MIFQIMPIVKVRASKYLAQLVQYQVYQSQLWPIICHFEFDQVENLLSMISLPETAHLVLSSYMARFGRYQAY